MTRALIEIAAGISEADRRIFIEWSKIPPPWSRPHLAHFSAAMIHAAWASDEKLTEILRDAYSRPLNALEPPLTLKIQEWLEELFARGPQAPQGLMREGELEAMAPDPAEEEVVALIEQTRGPNRLNPVEPPDAVKALFYRFAYSRYGVVLLSVGRLIPTDWDSEQADRIEGLSDGRIRALKKGAAPTEEERNALAEIILEEAAEDGGPYEASARVYWIQHPNEPVSKPGVYFVHVTFHPDPWTMETTACAGPFPTLDEAMDFFGKHAGEDWDHENAEVTAEYHLARSL